jgi:8-hydroxy-5-deazaflavin:NADPH oxidoreductase
VSQTPAVVSDRPCEPVCIVGASGALGFGLALRLGLCGLPIVIGSRDSSRAQEAAARAGALVAGARFSGAENAVAITEARIVILSVPFRSQPETLGSLRQAWRGGQILIDATVPLAAAVGGRATRMLGVWQGSAAQQAQELVGEGVGVVSALHTVSATNLADLAAPLAEDVLLCGDSRDHKREVAALIERIEGLRCVDCGRLEMARITESLTALLISVNGRYKAHAGVRLSGLPERLWE